jgi:putative endonuclease
VSATFRIAIIYQRLAKVFLICSDEPIIVVLAKARTHYPKSEFVTALEPRMNAARSYYVYILASRHHGTLYIGITSDIRVRIEAHRTGRGSQFVKKYGVFRLVHLEEFATPLEAIAREKQLKFWKRDWKIKLIEQENPDWNDHSGLI